MAQNQFKIHSEFEDENKFHFNVSTFKISLTIMQIVTVAAGLFLWFILAKPLMGVAYDIPFILVTLLIVFLVAITAFVKFPLSSSGMPAGQYLLLVPLRILRHRRKHKTLYIQYLDRDEDN